MKLGMSSAVFYGYLETEDAAAALKDYGLQTCEVFLETHSGVFPASRFIPRERSLNRIFSGNPPGSTGTPWRFSAGYARRGRP